MTPRRIAAGAFVLALAAACGDAGVDAPSAGAAVDESRPEPLLVFASHEDEAWLASLFDGFTRETGIRVTVRHRDDAANVDDMIAKRSTPQPDVLITQSVAGAWRAAAEGMLRPLVSATADAPDWLRDPDGYWAALGYSTIVVAYDADSVDPDQLSNYASLGEPAFRERLCLSASRLAPNTALIANLVAVHGRRPAEIIVRGWVGNLALPPFASERRLLDAIAGGTCGVGIVSMRAVRAWREQQAADAFAVHVPAPAYADAVAAGVGRHARSPEAATRLLDWLLEVPQQQVLAGGFGVTPVIGPATPGSGAAYAADAGVASGGAFADEAILLAERAAWR